MIYLIGFINREGYFQFINIILILKCSILITIKDLLLDDFHILP